MRTVKSTIKSVTRFKSQSAFILTGLVMGLASAFIISAWTLQELRFDRFHHQPDRIFMLTTDIRDNTGNVNRFPETPAPLASELTLQIPQIDKAFHFLYLYGGRTLGSGENLFKEEGLAATPDFFEVLNFRLVSGSASELDHPNSILISRELSEKLFPGSDPINQELIYKEDQVLVVKGIFRACPMNSSLQFNFVIPYEIEYGISDEWWQLSDATFMKLQPGADPGTVHNLIRNIWRERITDEQFGIGMISIADLRYGADFEFFNAEHGHGDKKKLYMFLGVAIVILILACLNYLILASSNALKREKEIWVRKIHGASAKTITGGFILESVLFSIRAWVLAALIAFLGLRFFENLVGVAVSLPYFYVCVGLGLIASILLVGFATGFYPAIKAGSKVLISKNESGRPGIHFQRNLRNIFVGSQFILSIALTISGLIIFRQASFMKHFDTGYSVEDIIEFRLPVNSDASFHTAGDWLESHPDIENYSQASASPVLLTVLNTTEAWSWKGLEESSYTSLFTINADDHYADLFGIPLKSGRFFSSTDIGQDKVVINEKLASLMGFEDPVGQIIRRGDEENEVIGIVRDFHFQHLSKTIRPFVFRQTGSDKHLFVKVRTDAIQLAGKIQKELSDILGQPVQFSFVDEDRDRLYEGESQILAAILFFTLLCIVLSSLGLIGMVSHSTVARTKEVAVRKVFGAASVEIMILQYLKIAKLFLPGMCIGGGLAWFLMRRWLEGYAQRNGMEGWVFLLGPALILIIAILSISTQTWNSSRKSPAISLKHL